MARENRRAPPVGARGAGPARQALSQNVDAGNATINISEPADWQDATLIARQRHLCSRFLIKPSFAAVIAEAMAPEAGR
jgi:hypothetical protein